MKELAIASVEMQEWEPLCTPQQALRQGSVFDCLHKPFFAEQTGVQQVQEAGGRTAGMSEHQSRDARLLEIQQVTFFLIDLQLFLDTHPGHTQAKEMKLQYQQMRKELLAKFAQDFYPLTMDCQGEQMTEIVPWEGGNDYVAV